MAGYLSEVDILLVVNFRIKAAALVKRIIQLPISSKPNQYLKMRARNETNIKLENYFIIKRPDNGLSMSLTFNFREGLFVQSRIMIILR